MAKKHVAVSLRRPPPPADLESLVVAAAGPQLAALKAESGRDSLKKSRRRAPVAPAIEPAVIASANDAGIVDALDVAVETKVVPVAADAFVGIHDAHDVHDVHPTDDLPSAARADVRTLTLELPTAVVDRLLAYCKLHGRDVHEVVADILARHLAQDGSVATDSTTAQAIASLAALVDWVRARLRLVASIRRRLVELGRMVYAAM